MAIVFPFLWIAGVFAISALYRRAKGQPIAPRSPADALFCENWRSGRSLRNWLTQIGGARSCLMVCIQDGELWVTPKFPFNLMFLPEIYGLDVRVPLSSIASVEPRKSLFGRVLRIAFVEDGPASMELHLHDEAGFIHHLGDAHVLAGDRAPGSPDKAPRRYRVIFFRIFAAIWGTGALFAAFSGLADDYRYRQGGIEITGIFDGYPGNADPNTSSGILSYLIEGRRYHVSSSHGRGNWKIGQTEQLLYLPVDPGNAREIGYLYFDLMWLGLGTVALALSALGGRIARLLT